ncbi:3'-5' exoribonuclease YhaM family protein [Agrilactobacillus yilanensis]|uniref:3'-5' exoribonuclease YhaM family protein n=1 Tax=Agrilactobacillus yilanensis TaxID=2485997 RepID=A0ABW4J8N3_9LACO|nr:HD domain-containing protein [Agrilactobacillus yilanensis]
MEKGLRDYQDGDRVDQNVLIKDADIRTAKNGKPFIALVFSDVTGQITGKFWAAQPEDIANFKKGRIVHLKGLREIYQTKPQIRIDKMTVMTNETLKAEDFVPKAPLPKTDLQSELNAFIFKITEAKWNRIVRYLLNERGDDFFKYPAAKTNHHAYEGGLAFHTISMLHLAEAMCRQYATINQSLLYAGIILHDLGKTIELSGAETTSYTLAGNLVGHIVLIDEAISRACNELHFDLDDEKIVILRHVILAHHGKLEYGSPVIPKILEAEVLHQLDEMDASVTMISDALNHTPSGHYTQRIFAMDQRQFYKP